MKELYVHCFIFGQEFAVKVSNMFICSVNLSFVLETGYFEGLKGFRFGEKLTAWRCVCEMGCASLYICFEYIHCYAKGIDIVSFDSIPDIVYGLDLAFRL